MKFVILVILVVCRESAGVSGISYKQCDEKSTCIKMDFLQKLLEGDQYDNIKTRPIFFASLQAESFVLNGIDDVIKFDDVKINRGGGYHPSTGAFRAPRSGVYHISCTIMAIGNGQVQFHLMKNGSIYTNGHASAGDFDSGTISILVELKKGDHIYIKHRTGNSQKVFGGHYSNFSGYFIEQ